MRHKLFWFTAFLFLLLAGCATTPVEATAAIGGGVTVTTAFLTDLFGLVKPFLKPEDVAKLGAALGKATTWTEAVGNMMGSIGQGLADLRHGVESTAAQVQEVASNSLSKTEAAGYVASGVVADRGISAVQRAHRRSKAAAAK
jgi:hypothetical protein